MHPTEWLLGFCCVKVAALLTALHSTHCCQIFHDIVTVFTFMLFGAEQMVQNTLEVFFLFSH